MSTKKKTKDKARYFPPEIMPFALCAACLDIVLEQSEKARELYEEIVDCFSLPGCQEIMVKAGEYLPDNKTLLKKLVKKSGFDINKPPSKDSFGIPYIRGILKGGYSLLSEYAGKITPRIWKGRRSKRDLMIIINKLTELIKIGFNREEDQLASELNSWVFKLVQLNIYRTCLNCLILIE